jgi:putative transposase
MYLNKYPPDRPTMRNPLNHPFIELLDLAADTLAMVLFNPESIREHDARVAQNQGRELPELYPPVEAHKSPLTRRIITPYQETCYLLTTRFCSNTAFFTEPAMRVFRAQLEQTAHFCGIVVLNYTLLEDHFHLLVDVPAEASRKAVTTTEIIARVASFYSEEYAALLAEAVASDPAVRAVEHFRSIWLRRGVKLAAPDESAKAWAARELERLRGMMHDVVMFMKLIKQRFSLWFNSEHERYGTLWGDTFRSLLVERTAISVQAASAYIDLNAVRRGLVENPAEYEFCGLGEAHREGGMGRDGLTKVITGYGETEISNAWAVVAEEHRSLLWGKELKDQQPGKPTRASEMPSMRSSELRLADFFLYSHDLFLRGVAMGSQPFIRQLFSNNREAFGLVSRRMAAYVLRYKQSIHAGSWGYEGMWVLRAKSSALKSA